MTDVTTYAIAGYADKEQPAYLTSPAGMGWLAGRAHRQAGRPEPMRARMSRGDAVRVDVWFYRWPFDEEA